MGTFDIPKPRRASSGFLHEFLKNKVLFFMMSPGIILLLIFCYLPMFGLIIAFKNLNYAKGILGSDWYGFKNFEFFIKTPYAFIITRNTILYNLAFLTIGTIVAVSFAIALNELRSRRLAGIYQSFMFLPYFLSWIVVSYLVFAFLSVDMGFLNRTVLQFFGISPVQWYAEGKYWPYILILADVWKYAGYHSVIYLATLVGLDVELYEAAILDGATKWQQITKITIPLLTPLITIMVLLGVGRIFFADFGLFYQVTMDSGQIFDMTNVIDTYVYRTLIVSGDVGMSSAAGLYQSVVGFVLVLASNLIVRRVDKEKALF